MKPSIFLWLMTNGKIGRLCANILAPLGFHISEATNGREGIVKAIECRPDMILMDLIMPIMDGFESTRAIRQTPELKDVIIIALSASVFEENRQESRQAGCHDFLPKPVEAEALLEKIRTYLDLEWEYESERKVDSQKEDRVEGLVAPPHQQLATLLEAVKKGRIMAIREHIDQIEKLGPSYVSFCRGTSSPDHAFPNEATHRISEQVRGSAVAKIR